MLEELLVVSATALYIGVTILVGEILDRLSKVSLYFINKIAQ